jgi:hypothetical protein
MRGQLEFTQHPFGRSANIVQDIDKAHKQAAPCQNNLFHGHTLGTFSSPALPIRAVVYETNVIVPGFRSHFCVFDRSNSKAPAPGPGPSRDDFVKSPVSSDFGAPR